MNSEGSQTLVSRSGTDKALRNWKNITAEVLLVAIVVTEGAAILAVSLASGIFYHEVIYGQSGSVLAFLQIGALTAAIIIISNIFRGEYRLTNFLSYSPHPGRSARLWNATFVFLLLIGFLGKISVSYSRGWLVLFYLSGLVILLLLRYGAVEAVRHASGAGLIATKRVFLLGTAREIEEFVAHYEPARLGIDIVGCRFFGAAAYVGSGEARHAALQRDLGAALRSARHLEPDAIFIVTPWSDAEAIDGSVEAMLSLPAEIHLGPDHALYKYHNVQLAHLGPIASLQLTRLPLSRLELIEKRSFDLFFATVGLILLAPLLVLVALLIKLDSRGPVFFLQQRYGFNQQPFQIIKFRTMRTQDDGVHVPQATRNDPRITRLGYWLRRFNIDEIPQLFNVLRGEMSLVGPRPHALAHNREFEQVIARYARRHNVKPGITGWAQIHGLRGETDTNEKMQRRVEHDLFYIDNWSIARDFMILVKTVISRAAYRNAY